MNIEINKFAVYDNTINFEMIINPVNNVILTETSFSYKIDGNTLFIFAKVFPFPDFIDTYLPFKILNNYSIIKNNFKLNKKIIISQKSNIEYFEDETLINNLDQIKKTVICIGIISECKPNDLLLFIDKDENNYDILEKRYNYLLDNQKDLSFTYIKKNNSWEKYNNTSV